VARTIGKDKVSAPRRGGKVDAEPIGDRPEDEPRDADLVENDEDALDGDEEEADEAPRDEDLVVTGGAVTHTRPAPVARAMTVPEPLMGNPFTRFVAESYIELRKVTWPTWSEAWNMTIVVIVVAALVAAILGLADAGLVQLLTWIVGHS
jgi:preprotein translocase subunit SecE